MIPQVPKPFIYAGIILGVLLLLPPAIIARARSQNSPKPRIHYVLDMDNQHRFKAQQVNPLFTDGRAMRPLVAGTVARGELGDDEHYHKGVIGDEWATTFPRQITVDMDLLRRGQERYNIYCALCHSRVGDGQGIIHQRALELMNSPMLSNGTSWVPPKSLHEEQIVAQPVGQIYNTITNGVRNMAGYKSQVPVDDRWAIVAYVRALQRSQNAEAGDVDNAAGLPVVDIQLESTEAGS